MARTTLDIDDSILRELKDLREREGKTLGQIASELLAQALARRGESRTGEEPARFEWFAKPMRRLVDLDDKDAVEAAELEDELRE